MRFAVTVLGNVTEPSGKHTFTATPTQGKGSERQRCECGLTLRKRARNADDEKLLINEAFMLGNLRSTAEESALPFLPELVSVGPGDDGNWCNTFAFLDGFYTLEEVKAKHGALDQRDAAWMFRRLLVVIGVAQDCEITHNAPTPDHVMIHPEKHGLVLVDWSHATSSADVEESPPMSDLHAAAATAVWLMGGDPEEQTFHDGVERETRAYFTALLNGTPLHPHEALGYYNELLEKVYGPRKFRPFSMA